MFWRALVFFHNDVEKRRAILVVCCLNDLYGCYASLQTFLHFSNNGKTTKKKQNNSQDHPIKYLKNLPKTRLKRNSSIFWIRPGQTSSLWDNFYAGQGIIEEWKENFCMSQKQKNYALSWDLTLKKTKEFEIQFQWRNKWPQHIACRWRQGVKNGNFFWYREINSFENNHECFVFYSPVYLQNNYFTNKKSYRVDTATESYWKLMKTRNVK